MFTGIVEAIGEVKKIESEGTNKHFTIQSKITKELKVDQSVSHNGVCLTVVSIHEDLYVVTAIKETLVKSNLDSLKINDEVNLERSVTMEKRLDGHMVQGHVDTTAECINVDEEGGSWLFTFQVDPEYDDLMVEKGSISINGTSLTIFNIKNGIFSVAIIPYTFENTIFHNIKKGMKVNIEFDMIGKYIMKYVKKLNF